MIREAFLLSASGENVESSFIYIIQWNGGVTMWPIGLVLMDKHVNIQCSSWAKFHVSSLLQVTGI